MNDCQCPYCEADVEICHDDGYGYEDGKVFEQYCSACGNTFTYTTSISYDYEVEKAPCLNGENHSWKDVHGYPPGYQSNHQYCEWCNKNSLKDETLKYDNATDTWVKR